MKQILRSTLETEGATVLDEVFALRLTSDDKELLELWTDYFRLKLTKEYGGTSLYITEGTYIMDDGEYVIEPSNLLEVACVDATQVFYFLAKRIVRYLTNTEQETVYISVNGVVSIATSKQIDEAIFLHDLVESIVQFDDIEESIKDFAPLPWSYNTDAGCFVDKNNLVILRPAVFNTEELDTLIKFILNAVNGESE